MIARNLFATALVAGLAPLAPAMAQSFTDSATVIATRPLMESVPVNREECWNEQRGGYEERSVTRQDNGQPIGPAGVGAIVGKPLDRETQRCRTVQDVREMPTGYEVRYRYGGREFLTTLPYDPGPRLRIAVDVRPVEEGAPPPRNPGTRPTAPRY